MEWLYGVPNHSLFDSFWAAIHFASGISLGLFLYYKKTPKKKAYYIALLLFIGWELLEVGLRNLSPELQTVMQTILHRGYFEPETGFNIFTDVLVDITGFYIGYYLFRLKVK